MGQVKDILTRFGVYIGITSLFVGLAVFEKKRATKNEKRTRKARLARARNAKGGKSSSTSKKSSSTPKKGISFKRYQAIKKKDPSKRSKQEKKDYFVYNMAKGRKKAK